MLLATNYFAIIWCFATLISCVALSLTLYPQLCCQTTRIVATGCRIRFHTLNVAYMYIWYIKTYKCMRGMPQERSNQYQKYWAAASATVSASDQQRHTCDSDIFTATTCKLTCSANLRLASERCLLLPLLMLMHGLGLEIFVNGGNLRKILSRISIRLTFLL